MNESKSNGEYHRQKFTFEEQKASKIFIGGLSQDHNDSILKEYFSKYGEILELNVKYDHQTGKSRGFAFLIFVDPSSAMKVFQEPAHIVMNKQVDPKLADQKARAQMQANTGHVDVVSRKVFIGGLDSDLNTDMVRESLSVFGKVIDIDWPIDKSVGKHRQFCFACFETKEQAESCLRAQTISIKGKMVRLRDLDVKKATPPTRSSGNANNAEKSSDSGGNDASYPPGPMGGGPNSSGPMPPWGGPPGFYGGAGPRGPWGDPYGYGFPPRFPGPYPPGPWGMPGFDYSQFYGYYPPPPWAMRPPFSGQGPAPPPPPVSSGGLSSQQQQQQQQPSTQQQSYGGWGQQGGGPQQQAGPYDYSGYGGGASQQQQQPQSSSSDPDLRSQQYYAGQMGGQQQSSGGGGGQNSSWPAAPPPPSSAPPYHDYSSWYQQMPGPTAGGAQQESSYGKAPPSHHAPPPAPFHPYAR